MPERLNMLRWVLPPASDTRHPRTGDGRPQGGGTMRVINCAVCAREIEVYQRTQLYCRACRDERKRIKQRDRKRRETAEYRAANLAPVPVVKPRVPKIARLRYSTLVATPEVPAENADRGEQLTGGASAVSYAQSVRLVGAGI